MRGQIFTIEGKKFFTFGGAYSIDHYMRVKNISYWDEEIPCKEEYDEAVKNLTLCDKNVDYIITHTAPREVINFVAKTHRLACGMKATFFLDLFLFSYILEKSKPDILLLSILV